MNLISIILFISSLAFSSLAFSAQVFKVKGNAVLIDTAGDNIQMGQTYYLISQNKKKGIIKIIKLRPGQALAKLIKGKALVNWTLRKRSPVVRKKKLTSKRVAPAPRLKVVKRKTKRKNHKSYSKNKKLAVGFALGYNSNSSEVTFVSPNPSPRTDSYTGTSLSYEIFADYQLKNKFYVRASLGAHNFNAEDSKNTLCTSPSGAQGTPCEVDLSYINLDIWLRYYLTQGKYNFWGGAGLGILLSPSYNSTTALQEDDLATTTLMQIGGGLDFKFSDKVYIPMWAEYGLFPSSDTVSMSSISGYIGLAYRL